MVFFIFCVFKIIINKNIVVSILMDTDTLNKLDFTMSVLKKSSKNAGIETDAFIKKKFDALALLFKDKPLAMSSMLK